jgi:hypothetical protein
VHHNVQAGLAFVSMAALSDLGRLTDAEKSKSI